MRNLRKFGDICNVVLRVADTFYVDSLRLVINSSSDIFGFVSLDKFYADSVLLEEDLKLIVCLTSIGCISAQRRKIS